MKCIVGQSVRNATGIAYEISFRRSVLEMSNNV